VQRYVATAVQAAVRDDGSLRIARELTHRRPRSVGEPAVPPPCTPGLVNAIFDATGKCIRQLPIGDQLKDI
jgi:hypothetical protein